MSLFRRKSEKNKTPPSSKPTAKQKNLQSPLPGRYEVKQNENHVVGSDMQSPAIPTPSGLLLFHEEHHPGDLGVSLGNTDAILEKKSRLSKSLQEFINHRDAIPQLIQYLEACKAGALIRFWLDADSFQASTWTRIRTHSLNIVSRSSLIKRRESGKQSKVKEKDITSPNSQSTDCETSCDKTDTSSLTPLSVDQEDASPLCNADSSLPNHIESPNQNSINSDNTEVKTSETSGRTDFSDEDQRDREKCKVEINKRLSLSLDLQDEHISNAYPLSTNSMDSGAVSAKSNSSVVSVPELNGNKDSPQQESDVISTSKTHTGQKDQLAEKLKKSIEQDAVRIFTKYLAREATHPISITDDLRNETIRKICREDGEVDPECFVECQKFVLDKIDREYYDDFKSSVYYCKHQVDILTGNKVFLNDILYNQTALFYFMEYMEQESLSHLLQFLLAADNFEEHLSGQETYDGQQAQEDAMVLYDKYFSLQAADPLGFPDSIRFEVEGNICREDGPLPDCFAKPRAIILQTIDKLHFPKYLTSDIYYKYLSELVSTVQMGQEFPLGPRKRRGSETSSEHSVGSQSVGNESISSKNTLLASGLTRKLQLSKLEDTMKEMTLDANLLNPDLLWKRQESGHMSLGKVDSLGHFESEFVPDPEHHVEKKSSSSRFFKRKKDKEKEQEEMARKIAEMIIKDVNSVTEAISAIKNPNAGHDGKKECT